MGNTTYFHRHMPDSPAGREIEPLQGDGDDIRERGRTIESLGERMQRAAATLRLIAEQQVGKGDSLDDITDQAADVHADLKQAGERYAPSGTALKAYGDRVVEVQPLLNGAAADAEAAWEVVRSRAADVDEAADVPTAEDGSTTARDEARVTAEGSLGAAKGDWESAAERFDRHYDSWERAYEHARDELRDANSGGVEDGFWDDALPFFEALVSVMEWAGLALLIAALIVGGPLIGVLAAIASVIALLGMIVLFAKGRKDGRDLAFAIIGVIPFGKLGKLSRLGDLAAGTARFPRLSGFRNLFLGAGDLGAMRTHLGAIDDLARQAWNGSTQGVLYDAATGGSRFIQRIISGAPYVARNLPPLGPTSGEMFVSRFAGYGDSLAGITDGQRLLTFAQGNATIMTQADFWNSKSEDVATDRLVDSWR